MFFPLIVFFTAFFARVIPNLTGKVYSSDQWEQIARIKVFKKIGGFTKKCPLRTTDGRVNADSDYSAPPLLHSLFIALPEKVALFFSPFIDAVHSLLCFYLAFFLFNDANTALVAGLIFALSPASVVQSWSFNPRALGSLFVSLFFVSSFFYLRSGELFFFLLPAVLFAGLTLLTHNFSSQALFTASVFVSIALGKLEILLVFLASVLFAVVFSRGYYLVVLKGQLNFLCFWRKEIAPAWFKDELSDTFKQLAKFVLLPFALVLAFTVQGFFFYWAFALFLVFFLTSFKPLRFLGEPHRYLSYAVLPVSLLVASLQLPVYWLVAGFVFCFLFLVYAGSRFFSRSFNSALPALRFLKKRGEKAVLCYPSALEPLVIYFAGKSVLASAPGSFHKLRGFFPVKTMPLVSIAKKHYLRLVLVEDAVLAFMGGGKRELRSCKKIFSKEGFSVYLVDLTVLK